MRVRYTYDPDVNGIEELVAYANGIFDEFDIEVMLDKMESPRQIVNEAEEQEAYETIVSSDTIAVFGDYDADGITASVIASHYLDDAKIFIPERDMGYGISEQSLRMIGDAPDLIVTVDCGITAGGFINAYSSHHGTDFIVTDHHAVDYNRLPDCQIVHPVIAGIGFTGYSGSAVAYKFFSEVLGEKPELSQLAAIGTVCDVMPMLDENRYIVRRGIDFIRNDPLPGVAAIIQATGLDLNGITEATIGWTIGPVINACGRMGQARLAYELLSTGSAALAEKLAKDAVALNDERKKILSSYTERLPDIVDHRGSIVFAVIDNLPDGFAGLLANNISKAYRLPAIVVSSTDRGYSASCRAPIGFDCSNMVRECGDFLVSGGGHQGAAGMVIKEGALSEFLNAATDYAYEHSTEKKPVAADIGIPSDMVPKLARRVLAMRPFGSHFRNPTFATVIVPESAKLIGSGKNHVRITANNTSFTLFNHDELPEIGEPYEVMFEYDEPFRFSREAASAIVFAMDRIQ